MRITKLAFLPVLALLGIAAATAPAPQSGLSPGTLNNCDPHVRQQPYPPAPILYVDYTELASGFRLELIATGEAERNRHPNTRAGTLDGRPFRDTHGTDLDDKVEWQNFDGNAPDNRTWFDFEVDTSTSAVSLTQGQINGDDIDPIDPYPHSGSYDPYGMLEAPQIIPFGTYPPGGSGQPRVRVQTTYFGVTTAITLVDK